MLISTPFNIFYILVKSSMAQVSQRFKERKPTLIPINTDATESKLEILVWMLKAIACVIPPEVPFQLIPQRQ